VFNNLEQYFPIYTHNGKSYDYDYIKYPKPNLYQALHRTIVGPNNELYQIQIMTEQMAAINDMGITYYWDDTAKMQEIFNSNFGFFKSILENSFISLGDPNFGYKNVEEEYSESIKVYNEKGIPIFLPIGCCVADFVYKCLRNDFVLNVDKVLINNEERPLSYPLKKNDVIELVYSKGVANITSDLLKYCVTQIAIEGIKKHLANQGNKDLTFKS
jgi:GTP pyrophosphokinase